MEWWMTLLGAEQRTSRSNVIRPLHWLLALCLSSLIGALKLQAPAWILIGLGALCVGAVILFGWAYIHFAVTDPDALRSENYLLRKMQLERLGDSYHGLASAEGSHSLPLVKTGQKELGPS